MKTLQRAARVMKPVPRLSLSGFVLLTLLMIPLAAHAQSGTPFDSGLTSIQNLFTGIVFDPTQSGHAVQQIVQGAQLNANTLQEMQTAIKAYNFTREMMTAPQMLYRCRPNRNTSN